jgi:hypothetical protein
LCAIVVVTVDVPPELETLDVPPAEPPPLPTEEVPPVLGVP